MKVSCVVLGALVTLSRAHYDPRDTHAGLPKLVGARQFLSELKARGALPEAFENQQLEKRHAVQTPESTEATLKGRQSTDQCGPNLGTCIASDCCSLEG